MNNNDEHIRTQYRARQSRQFIAIAVALFGVLSMAVVMKRPDLFGHYAVDTLSSIQLIFIASFIGVTYMNWRCPACNKYLGSNIIRQGCAKCGARLR